MTTSAATVERPQLFGLPERELDQVDETHPAGNAVQHAGNETQIGAPADRIRARIHHVTILSVIAAVQFTWIAALIYGVRLLLA
jgi:hypothetical protein